MKTSLMKRKNNNITRLQAEERIAFTAAMLLTLKSRRTIIDELVKTYGISPKSCDAIISNAYAYIKDNYKTDRESIVVKHLEFYYDLAAQWKDIDPRASLKALEQIEKLLKLHQDMPLIQSNTLNLNMDNVTDEQLMKAIEAIKQQKQNA
jgi:hypothetical protein